MSGPLVAVPGAFLDRDRGRALGHRRAPAQAARRVDEAATIVFGEHLVLVLIMLPVIPAAFAAVRRAGLRYVAAAAAIGIGASAIATILFTQAFVHGDPVTPVVLQKVQPLFAVVGAWFISASGRARSTAGSCSAASSARG